MKTDRVKNTTIHTELNIEPIDEKVHRHKVTRKNTCLQWIRTEFWEALKWC